MNYKDFFNEIQSYDYDRLDYFKSEFLKDILKTLKEDNKDAKIILIFLKNSAKKLNNIEDIEL